MFFFLKRIWQAVESTAQFICLLVTGFSWTTPHIGGAHCLHWGALHNCLPACFVSPTHPVWCSATLVVSFHMVFSVTGTLLWTSIQNCSCMSGYPVLKGILQSSQNYTWNTADSLGRGATAVVYLGREKVRFIFIHFVDHTVKSLSFFFLSFFF